MSFSADSTDEPPAKRIKMMHENDSSCTAAHNVTDNNALINNVPNNIDEHIHHSTITPPSTLFHSRVHNMTTPTPSDENISDVYTNPLWSVSSCQSTSMQLPTIASLVSCTTTTIPSTKDYHSMTMNNGAIHNSIIGADNNSIVCSNPGSMVIMNHVNQHQGIGNMSISLQQWDRFCQCTDILQHILSWLPAPISSQDVAQSYNHDPSDFILLHATREQQDKTIKHYHHRWIKQLFGYSRYTYPRRRPFCLYRHHYIHIKAKSLPQVCFLMRLLSCMPWCINVEFRPKCSLRRAYDHKPYFAQRLPTRGSWVIHCYDQKSTHLFLRHPAILSHLDDDSGIIKQEQSGVQQEEQPHEHKRHIAQRQHPLPSHSVMHMNHMDRRSNRDFKCCCFKCDEESQEAELSPSCIPEHRAPFHVHLSVNLHWIVYNDWKQLLDYVLQVKPSLLVFSIQSIWFAGAKECIESTYAPWAPYFQSLFMGSFLKSSNGYTPVHIRALLYNHFVHIRTLHIDVYNMSLETAKVILGAPFFVSHGIHALHIVDTSSCDSNHNNRKWHGPLVLASSAIPSNYEDTQSIDSPSLLLHGSPCQRQPLHQQEQLMEWHLQQGQPEGCIDAWHLLLYALYKPHSSIRHVKLSYVSLWQWENMLSPEWISFWSRLRSIALVSDCTVHPIHRIMFWRSNIPCYYESIDVEDDISSVCTLILTDGEVKALQETTTSVHLSVPLAHPMEMICNLLMHIRNLLTLQFVHKMALADIKYRLTQQQQQHGRDVTGQEKKHVDLAQEDVYDMHVDEYARQMERECFRVADSIPGKQLASISGWTDCCEYADDGHTVLWLITIQWRRCP